MKSFPVNKPCLPSLLAAELSAVPSLAALPNNVLGRDTDLVSGVAATAVVTIDDVAPDAAVLAVIAAHSAEAFSLDELRAVVAALSSADREALVTEMLAQWLCRSQEGAGKAKVKLKKVKP